MNVFLFTFCNTLFLFFVSWTALSTSRLDVLIKSIKLLRTFSFYCTFWQAHGISIKCRIFYLWMRHLHNAQKLDFDILQSETVIGTAHVLKKKVNKTHMEIHRNRARYMEWHQILNIYKHLKYAMKMSILWFNFLGGKVLDYFRIKYEVSWRIQNFEKILKNLFFYTHSSQRMMNK